MAGGDSGGLIENEDTSWSGHDKRSSVRQGKIGAITGLNGYELFNQGVPEAAVRRAGHRARDRTAPISGAAAADGHRAEGRRGTVIAPRKYSRGLEALRRSCVSKDVGRVSS